MDSRFVDKRFEISNLDLMRDMMRIISLDLGNIRNSKPLTYISASIC
jgi:hypothetical protein